VHEGRQRRLPPFAGMPARWMCCSRLRHRNSSNRSREQAKMFPRCSYIGVSFDTDETPTHLLSDHACRARAADCISARQHRRLSRLSYAGKLALQLPIPMIKHSNSPIKAVTSITRWLAPPATPVPLSYLSCLSSREDPYPLDRAGRSRKRRLAMKNGITVAPSGG
jgi:hypothetical protein